MTYSSNGRSMFELILAVGLVSFLIGFVAVLCIGNYYRAKRAMERQRHKRLARLSGHGGNGVVGVDSPRSDHSNASTQFNEEEAQHHHLLHPIGNHNTARRRNMDDYATTTDSLLFDVHDVGPNGRAHITAV